MKMNNITNDNNLKKRKHDIDDIKDESPQNKKRKMNKNNQEIIEDESLMNHSHYKLDKDQYEKQKNQYKQQMEHYRKQMKHYKAKYINLKKRIMLFNLDQINNDPDNAKLFYIENVEHNSNDNDNNDKISVISPAPSLPTSPSPLNMNIKVETDESNDDESTYIPISDNNAYIWEDCHYISVNCKFCGDFFDDFDEYMLDLRFHFDNDPKQIWLTCTETDCDSYLKTFGKQLFIAHLHRHGHENPFHCKMKDIDGKICTVSTSTKGNLISHLGTKKHNIILKPLKGKTILTKQEHDNINDEYHVDSDHDNDNNDDDYKEEEEEEEESEEYDDDDSDYEEEEEEDDYDDDDNEEEDEYTAIKTRRYKQNRYELEDCYMVSVDCKYCGKHFDDFDEYAFHLKQHFARDSSKTWRICKETGCDKFGKKSVGTQAFISHLHRHGHQNLFHCTMNDLLNDDKPCRYSVSLKCDLIKHLRSKKHNIIIPSLLAKGRRKRAIKRKKDKREKTTYHNFADCHYVSVDCKFCGKTFDDLNVYVDHLKDHYDADQSREWLKCNDVGCESNTKIFDNAQNFLRHIARHGHENPWHCKMKTLTGKICKYSSSSKGNMVRHLGTTIHYISVRKAKQKRKSRK